MSTTLLYASIALLTVAISISFGLLIGVIRLAKQVKKSERELVQIRSQGRSDYRSSISYADKRAEGLMLKIDGLIHTLEHHKEYTEKSLKQIEKDSQTTSEKLTKFSNEGNAALLNFNKGLAALERLKTQLANENKDSTKQLQLLQSEIITQSQKLQQTIASIQKEQQGQLTEIEQQKKTILKQHQRISLLSQSTGTHIEGLKKSIGKQMKSIRFLRHLDELRYSGVRNPSLTFPKSMEKDGDELKKLIYRENTTNHILYQYFQRHMEASDFARLERFWIPALNLSTNRRALGYLADRICKMESLCCGRYATNIQDAMIRALVAQSLARSGGLRMLEIGALFGINIVSLYESCRGWEEYFHVTALDPLDGYYGENKDPLTDMPVKESIFRHNLAKVDMPETSVRLVKRLSTEDKAIEEVGESTYNLLIIDGDHTYDGVKFDFDHYHQFVEIGGYILFDDFGGDEWPDVKSFVNKEVDPRNDIEFFGADWRTAIYKKVK